LVFQQPRLFSPVGFQAAFCWPRKIARNTEEEINLPVRFDGGPATNQQPDFSVIASLDAGLTRIEFNQAH